MSSLFLSFLFSLWIPYVASNPDVIDSLAFSHVLPLKKREILLDSSDQLPNRHDPIFNLTNSSSPGIRYLQDRSAINGRYLDIEAPIFGDFRKLAYFYSDIYIGTPPQRFSVISDTGSALMSVPCKSCNGCGTHLNPPYDPSLSSTASLLKCDNPGDCHGPGATCMSSTSTCHYTQSYAEGSTLRGVMYKDKVYIGGSEAGGPLSDYNIDFSFGCAEQEGGLFKTQLADGIMGLGLNNNGIISALLSSGKMKKQMFSLCLSLNNGVFTLGDMVPELHTSEIKWAKMTLTGFYEIEVESMHMEDKMLVTSKSTRHNILDSGTTFTYLPIHSFNSLKDEVNHFCDIPGNCVGHRVPVNGESICYKLDKPSDISTFPTVSITLKGVSGPVTLVTSQEHTFINMVWDKGAYCLAFYSNGNSGVVLGANFMMNKDVVFDTVGVDSSGPRVGFADSLCSYEDLEMKRNSGEVIPSVPPAVPGEENGVIISPNENPDLPHASPVPGIPSSNEGEKKDSPSQTFIDDVNHLIDPYVIQVPVKDVHRGMDSKVATVVLTLGFISLLILGVLAFIMLFGRCEIQCCRSIFIVQNRKFKRMIHVPDSDASPRVNSSAIASAVGGNQVTTLVSGMEYVHTGSGSRSSSGPTKSTDGSSGGTNIASSASSSSSANSNGSINNSNGSRNASKRKGTLVSSPPLGSDYISTSADIELGLRDDSIKMLEDLRDVSVQ